MTGALSLILNLRSASAAQIVGGQPLSGMLDAGKNRCLFCGEQRPKIAELSESDPMSDRDNFRDNLGTIGFAQVMKSVVYLAFSRGEVAERLKAAVC